MKKRSIFLAISGIIFTVFILVAFILCILDVISGGFYSLLVLGSILLFVLACSIFGYHDPSESHEEYLQRMRESFR